MLNPLMHGGSTQLLLSKLKERCRPKIPERFAGMLPCGKDFHALNDSPLNFMLHFLDMKCEDDRDGVSALQRSSAKRISHGFALL